MTVFLNANSISGLQFHPPGNSRRGEVAVSVNNKKYIEDFFPETMSFLSFDYMSVVCFEKQVTKLIKDVLTDIGALIKSELAQFDREEAEKKYYHTQFESITTQSENSQLHPSLRSKGMKFKGIPSHPQSKEDQKRLLGSAIYYKNLKPLMLMRIGQEYWFSLAALKMFEAREKELDRLYADAKIYETKVNYSAIGTATSLAPTSVPSAIATIAQIEIEDMHIAAIKQQTGSTTDPIDSMRFDRIRVGRTQPFKKMGKIAPYAQVISYVGLAAGVVNMGYNNLAAMHTYNAITAFYENMSGHFKKMSKVVCQDFEKLQDNEIEALMELLGINKNEYL